MNKNDLRSIIAKLHELEQGPTEPVNEAVPSFLNPFNFIKGLGAGGTKDAVPRVAIPKPKIDPTGLAHGAEEIVTAAVQNADTKLKLLRKITPAEAVAARAEGITLDELLMKKFPDTFAKLENNPELKTKVATEFSKAADEIIGAVERGEDPRALWPKEEKLFSKEGAKSFALSAMLHALIVLGLFIANKQSSSTSTSTSSSDVDSIPADEIPWSTYLGMDPRQGDSLKRGSHGGIAPWKIISPGGVAIGKINGPIIVDKIEKLAAMTPAERKKLAQAEPQIKYHEIELYPADSTTQPKVKELPKSPSADKGSSSSDAPENKPEIVIAKKKKKTKEEEEAERKKKEAAEAAKKAEEDKKRKILPPLTF